MDCGDQGGRGPCLGQSHSVAEIDKWEAAHFKEDEIRHQVKAAKKDYEDALRQKFFGF
jgi:hypothetical protein